MLSSLVTLITLPLTLVCQFTPLLALSRESREVLFFLVVSLEFYHLSTHPSLASSLKVMS